MTRLTKDQRRQQKKKREQKADRQREHSLNRQFKHFDTAMLAITAAMRGVGDRESLEEALLSLFKQNNTTDRPDPFVWESWKRVKQRISSLVRIHTELDINGDSVAMKGRVYFVEDDSCLVEYFPLQAMLASKWKPQEVVLNLGLELEPTPENEKVHYIPEGVYLFGVEFGYYPVHFAFVNKLGVPNDAYMVTNSGWHLLGGQLADELLMQVIMSAYTKSTMDEPHRHVEVELIEHLAPFESDDDADYKPLSEKGRGIIVSAGRALLAEMENIQNTAMLHDTESYDSGWDEGLQEGLAETRALQERLQVAEKELHELRRKPPVVASPAKPEATHARSLSERMGALLAPVQAPV